MICLSLYQQISIHCFYAIAVTKMIMSLNMFMATCTVLEWLKTNSHSVVCLFGFCCHWHGADLLSSDPVELSNVFFMLVGIKSLFIAGDNLEHLSSFLQQPLQVYSVRLTLLEISGTCILELREM